jgi:hypothetical protein
MLFAEDIARSTTGESSATAAPLLCFGAQGPDFFFHNGLTRPSGRTFGARLHRHRFGRFVVEVLRSCPPPVPRELRSYLAGFVTHAFLDRAAHPFIDYFAGWEVPDRPETARYFRCHAFMERVLDVVTLERRRGTSMAAFRPTKRLDCGEALPESVVRALAEGLRRTFPGLRMTENAEVRVANAFRDARGFYRYTGSEQGRMWALREDQSGEFRRRLALFHPRAIPPDLDPANESHREWVHPCDAGERSSESFHDLYDRALAAATGAVATLRACLAGEVGPGQLEAAVGNESLNTTSRTRRVRLYNDPLPLPELLQAQYEGP